jgi:hypothetical protein
MHRAVLLLALFSVRALAVPVVFWASDPVGPDDTVLVAGSDFGKTPRLRVDALRKGVSSEPDATPEWTGKGDVLIDAQQATPESAKFLLPGNLKEGAYVCRIESETGESAAFGLNLPTVYWHQGDRGLHKASPGGWLRVFGRCVGSPAAEGRLILRNAAGKDLKLIPSKSTLWDVEIRLPEDMVTGTYTAYLHSGLGRQYGWRELGEIEVSQDKPWPTKVFNVQEFGAAGDGGLADSIAVGSALAAAEENGGGVVYFPRGRYAVEGTLTIPRNTVLRGEGRTLSCLCWPDSEEPFNLIEGTDHFGVEDLTLYASNYKHGIVADQRTPEAGHTFVRRVTMRAVIYRGHLKPEEVDRRFRESLRLSTGGGDSIRLGGEDVEVTDCDLYGSGRAFYFYGVKGGVVANNRFYNGRWGWYCITGADGLIYENNVLTGADLMSTGGGINCLGSVYSRNVFYAGNTVARCHGWDREAMTSDAGGGPFYGKAESCNGQELVLPEKPNWRGRDWTGAGIFVLMGKGEGQYREIAGVSEDGRTITMDRAWTVPIDDTSLIVVTMMQRNYLFIGNHFEDAGIALQYYGTSINHVAVGNTATRCGGFYNSGRWYHQYQPSWYCQFMGNRILDGNCYRFGANNATSSGPSFIGTYGLQRGDNPAPLAYCSVHRGNVLENNSLIRVQGLNKERPGVRDVIIEHNTVRNASVGMQIDDGCVGVLARDNHFENVAERMYDPEKEKAKRMAQRQKLLEQQAPVYYQTFDEKHGRYFLDSSGNGFAGIQVGTPIESEPGVSGQAGRFDGKGYLLVNDRSMLRFPNTTISAWIRPDQIKGRWGVVAKRRTNTSAAFVLAIRNGSVCFEGTATTGVWTYNLQSAAVVKGGWHHVAAICEEGKRVRLFYDGQQVAAKKVTEDLVDNSQPLTIGYEAWGGAGSSPREPGNFIGLIDEVKIWSRMLSDEEVQAQYEALHQQAANDAVRRAEEAKKREQELKAARSGKMIDTAGVPWRLVATDEFSGNKLDDQWQSLRGKWQVKDGILSCSEVSFLGTAKAVKPPVRIEFRARAKTPSDLSAFVGSKGGTFQDGYFIGFASNGNSKCKLLRLGEEVAQSDKTKAVPGQWHHVIAQILTDGRVQLLVDGKMALEYRDPKPLRKLETAGILAWGAGQFDWLKVYTAE